MSVKSIYATFRSQKTVHSVERRSEILLYFAELAGV